MSWVSITFSPACLGLSSTRVRKCEHAFVSATYTGNMEHVLRAYWKAGVGLSTDYFAGWGTWYGTLSIPPLPSDGYVKQSWGVLLQISQCKTRFVEVAVSLISQQKTHTLKLLFLSHFRVQNSL